MRDAAHQELEALDRQELALERVRLPIGENPPLLFGRDNWRERQMAKPEVSAYFEKKGEIERRKKMALGLLSLATSRLDYQ
jgi:hypothetical protein